MINKAIHRFEKKMATGMFFIRHFIYLQECEG
jgi:hypothetical protein